MMRRPYLIIVLFIEIIETWIRDQARILYLLFLYIWFY